MKNRSRQSRPEAPSVRGGRATLVGPELEGAVREHLRSVLPPDLIKASRISYHPRVFDPGEAISLVLTDLPVTRPSVFVFVDEAPRYGWAHGARALLFDALRGGFHRQVPACFPPVWRGRDCAKASQIGARIIPAATPAPTRDLIRRRKGAGAARLITWLVLPMLPARAGHRLAPCLQRSS